MNRRDILAETVRHAFIALILIALLLGFVTCSMREIAKDPMPHHHTGP